MKYLINCEVKNVNAYVNTTKLTDGISDKIDHIPFVAELIVN